VDTELSNEKITYTKVYFVNDSLGFMIGSKGTIFRSNDGGLIWNKIESGTKLMLHSISFIDDKRGFIAGNDMVCLKTTDGGLTWQDNTLDIFKGIAFLEVIFHDNIGILNGSNGELFNRIYHSSDYGETWKEIHLEGQNNNTIMPDDVAFFDKKNAIMINYFEQLYLKPKKMFRTSDSGLTWEEIEYPTEGEMRYDRICSLKYIENRLYGVTGYGLLVSDNYGKSWKKYTTGKAELNGSYQQIKLRDIAIGKNEIFVSGAYGIFKLVIK